MFSRLHTNTAHPIGLIDSLILSIKSFLKGSYTGIPSKVTESSRSMRLAKTSCLSPNPGITHELAGICTASFMGKGEQEGENLTFLVPSLYWFPPSERLGVFIQNKEKYVEAKGPKERQPN